MASVVIAPTIILSDIPVGAQEIKEIGQFGDWKAYIRSDNNERFCYIVSKPKEASLRSRRGDIFLMVWHRPAKKEFDVVQVDAGYTYKKDKNGKKISTISGSPVEWVEEESYFFKLSKWANKLLKFYKENETQKPHEPEKHEKA